MHFQLCPLTLSISVLEDRPWLWVGLILPSVPHVESCADFDPKLVRTELKTPKFWRYFPVSALFIFIGLIGPWSGSCPFPFGIQCFLWGLISVLMNISLHQAEPVDCGCGPQCVPVCLLHLRIGSICMPYACRSASLVLGAVVCTVDFLL